MPPLLQIESRQKFTEKSKTRARIYVRKNPEVMEKCVALGAKGQAEISVLWITGLWEKPGEKMPESANLSLWGGFFKQEMPTTALVLGQLNS